MPSSGSRPVQPGYLSYEDDAANVLFHVVNERHARRRAMVFTTNKSPKKWGDVLHDPDLAEAIVDRILERGRLLKLDGPSMRTRHVPRADLEDETEPERPLRVSGTDRSEFPERTRAMLNGARVPLVMCVDEGHADPGLAADPRVVLFKKRVDVRALLRACERALE